MPCFFGLSFFFPAPFPYAIFCIFLPACYDCTVLLHFTYQCWQDYGKDRMATVPKYDGFCTVPDHLNYRKEIDGFLNLYEPIGHTPQIGDFPHTLSSGAHFRRTVRVSVWTTCSCSTCSRCRNSYTPARIRREEHGQKHVPQLPESHFPRQRDVQHQRGLPQPVQFRLGREAAHYGGRSTAQP